MGRYYQNLTIKIVNSHDDSDPPKFAKMSVICRPFFPCFPSEILEARYRARVKGNVRALETP